MKYRMIGALMAVILLLSTALVVLTDTSEREGSRRVHQHLSEPGYTPCSGHGDEVFCSHLPLVFIETEGQKVPGVPLAHDRFKQDTYTKAPDGTDYINVSVSVVDNDQGNNHIDDEPDFITRSLFRIRGNSSRNFEKLPYLMKFVDDQGEDRSIGVMGMAAHNEWALHGPYMDKSLVRNYMWFNIAGEMMSYAPNVRYCELFVDGEYRGLYLMMETITNGEECRLNLTDSYNGNEMTGYLLRLDRPTEEDLETARDVYSFMERTNILSSDAAIRYPGKNKLTPELAKDIELDFARFEKCLYSYDYDTKGYGYWNWIDVDSFVDYFIINEFTRNLDAGYYSTYYYKEVGEKLRACVWDFNNACDNYAETKFSPKGLTFNQVPIFFMLTKDQKFAEAVIQRYEELRETWLSDEYLENYIDGVLAYLGPAIDRNNTLWAAAFSDYEPLIPAERNRHSHDAAVTQLKAWLKARGAWMDTNIDAVRAWANPGRTRQYNH